MTKNYEVDISYESSVTNTATITVKAKSEEEAEEYVTKNMFSGKDFVNSAIWDEETDENSDVEIQDIREVGDEDD